MKKIFAFLFLGILADSCNTVFRNKIKGNGNIKTETRTAGVFNSVDVHGNIDLYVKQDSSSTVKVEADEHLMNYIMVRTEGDVLVIEPKDGYNLSGSKHIKVYASSPVFKRLGASGACNIIGENKITSAERISIDLSGASGLELELRAPQVTAELSGAGAVESRGETKDFSVGGS